MTRSAADERHEEVYFVWFCAPRLSGAYRHPDPAAGKNIAEQIIRSLPTCPIPEILRLSRTLKQWREAFLAYPTTSRSSNGGTEAINGLIELYRRVARGFKDPGDYRLRMDAPHRWRTHQPPAQLRGARLITEFRSPGVRAR